MGQTSLASQIMAMNQLVAGTAQANGKSASYVSDQFIKGVNTYNMVMVNLGTDVTAILSGAEEYSGSYTENGVVGLNMTASYDNSRPRNTLYDTYKEMTGGKAPIFQTSDGGIAYTDGETGCYGISGDNFYTGKYITIYYSGIGIMLEYYH